MTQITRIKNIDASFLIREICVIRVKIYLRLNYLYSRPFVSHLPNSESIPKPTKYYSIFPIGILFHRHIIFLFSLFIEN